MERLRSDPDGPIARLMIVDDEPAQMRALCETLRTEGYDTRGFSGGREALAALQPGGFDLLLTDLAMPEMDGIALLREAQGLDPDLVGIIMTGAGTIASAVEAMKVGALDYVLKPFKLSAVLPVLVRALHVRNLRRENEELQRRLAAHAAQLEAANRSLDAANKDLDAFAHSVSHDLRAPLRAVSGFARIVASDYSAQLPARGQELLGNVLAAARRMNHLIDDLLRFSHVGQQSLVKGSVSATALVQEVLAGLQGDLVGREVEIRVGVLPDVAADRALLRQVFENLLANAVKFTRNRTRAVIEVGSREEQGQSVYFVRDNGAGFDMRYAQHLFGVFQRMHTEQEFPGTGVGLSLAYRIVQRHGGRIWAEAEVDKGAAFHFTLSP